MRLNKILSIMATKPTVNSEAKTLKVKPGAEKFRVSMKGYKGNLGAMSQEQLRTFLDMHKEKFAFIVEA